MVTGKGKVGARFRRGASGRIDGIGLATILLLGGSLLQQAALADDRKPLDYRQLKGDDKISGQMLCALVLGIMTETIVANCKLTRKPADDAIDRAVLSIENYMIANSSQHPTQETFETLRKDFSENLKRAKTPPEAACGGKDFDKWFRSDTPEQIDANVRKLLATPPGPDPVPCL